jgi:uncharacterized coiled-coil protein SlyX
MKTTDYVLILSSSVQAALQTMQELEAREAKNASGGDHLSDQLYELRSITLTLADQTKLLRERLDRLESIDTERRVHDSLRTAIDRELKDLHLDTDTDTFTPATPKAERDAASAPRPSPTRPRAAATKDRS